MTTKPEDRATRITSQIEILSQSQLLARIPIYNLIEHAQQRAEEEAIEEMTSSGLKGKDLWNLYKHECGEDIEKFRNALKAKSCT